MGTAVYKWDGISAASPIANMNFDINRPYDSDYALLAELCLPRWKAPHRTEAFIGEVQPFAETEVPEERTKVKIYVTCAPAQFYRFVIERRSGAEGAAGMEEVEISTGSGNLSRYWPMVMAVVNNCFVVGQPKPVGTAPGLQPVGGR
jgi:hypothetical protein